MSGGDVLALSLTGRLAELGASALSDAIRALADGTATRTPQDETQQSYASMLSRDMSPIDWSRSARAISCQVRGLIPWPGAATDKAPGTVLSAGKRGIEVACGDGQSLFITELQAEGGKRMAAAAYLLGHPMEV